MKNVLDFRVGSLNIANGAGDEYRTLEAREKQAQFIKSKGLDIVGMQEVDVDVRRSGMVHTGALSIGYKEVYRKAKLDGKTFVSHLGNGGTLVFGTSFVFDDKVCDVTDGSPCDTSGKARYGNAIYLDNEIQLLRADTVPYTLGEEPRTYLIVAVLLPEGTKLTVINTHLTVYGENAKEIRASQLAELSTVVKKTPGLVIVMGDFNAGHREVKEYLAPLVDMTIYNTSDDSPDQMWADNDIFFSGLSTATNGISDHEYAAIGNFRIHKDYE